MRKANANELNEFSDNTAKQVINEISKTLHDLNSTVNTIASDQKICFISTK